MQINIISRSIANVVSRFDVKGTQILAAFCNVSPMQWRLDLSTGSYSDGHIGERETLLVMPTESQAIDGRYLPNAMGPIPKQASQSILRQLFQRIG